MSEGMIPTETELTRRLVIGAAPEDQVAAALERIRAAAPDDEIHLLTPESRIASLKARHPWIVAHGYRAPRITPELSREPALAPLRTLRFRRITVVLAADDPAGYLPVFRFARRIGELPAIAMHLPDGRESDFSYFSHLGRELAHTAHATRIGRKLWNLWRYRSKFKRVSGLTWLRLAADHLLFDDELHNFTYELANRDELIAWLVARFAVEAAEVRRLIEELENDAELAASLSARLAARGRRRLRPGYGRRLGWYVMVRLSRPRLVVETGVHDGLGTAILGRALARNAAEGVPGRLLSFDVNPGCGWLVDPRLAGEYRLVIGDCRRTLPETLAGETVDLFIHDSLHTHAHETFELECVTRRAADGALLLSDNAHAVPALSDFCSRHGLDYSFFAEMPRDHFYPGAGIGLARWRAR